MPVKESNKYDQWSVIMFTQEANRMATKNAGVMDFLWAWTKKNLRGYCFNAVVYPVSSKSTCFKEKHTKFLNEIYYLNV